VIIDTTQPVFLDNASDAITAAACQDVLPKLPRQSLQYQLYDATYAAANELE
jgi:hypothetical protein